MRADASASFTPAQHKVFWPALTDLMKKECADMALKCLNVARSLTPEPAPMKLRRLNLMVSVPESGMFLHIYRTGKRDTIIMKPRFNEQESDKAKMRKNNSKLSIAMAPHQSCQTVANSCLISKIRPRSLGPVPGFLRLFPGWPESV